MSKPLSRERMAEMRQAIADARNRQYVTNTATYPFWHDMLAEALTETNRLTDELADYRRAWEGGADAASLGDALARADKAEAAIARVKALHTREDVFCITGACAAEECEHDELKYCEKVRIEVCAECLRVAEAGSRYYGEQGLEDVEYPCPTIRAIEGSTVQDPRGEDQ